MRVQMRMLRDHIPIKGYLMGEAGTTIRYLELTGWNHTRKLYINNNASYGTTEVIRGNSVLVLVYWLRKTLQQFLRYINTLYTKSICISELQKKKECFDLCTDVNSRVIAKWTFKGRGTNGNVSRLVIIGHFNHFTKKNKYRHVMQTATAVGVRRVTSSHPDLICPLFSCWSGICGVLCLVYALAGWSYSMYCGWNWKTLR